MGSLRSAQTKLVGVFLAAALVGLGGGAVVGLVQRAGGADPQVGPGSVDTTTRPTEVTSSLPSTTSSTTSAPTGTAAPSTATPSSSLPRTPTTTASGSGGAAAGAPAGWRADMLAAINAARRDAGVADLSWCRTLASNAQSYADVLRDWGQISHTGPDGSTLSSRLAASGYTGWKLAGENLASGQPDAVAVLAAWFDSSPHRANLLNSTYTHFGVGRADATEGGRTVPYWVQVFGTGGSC